MIANHINNRENMNTVMNLMDAEEEARIERGFERLAESRLHDTQALAKASNRRRPYVFGNAYNHIVRTIFNEDGEREIHLVKSEDRQSINLVFTRPLTERDKIYLREMQTDKVCVWSNYHNRWLIGYRVSKAIWQAATNAYHRGTPLEMQAI